MRCSGVLLIGPRGAGKSAVGAALAPRLGLPFHDTDAVVEAATGGTVAALLAAGSFRGHEEAALARLLGGGAAVVAAGGGAVLWAGLARAARGWRVVWLDAAPPVLAARIRDDPQARPSLTGAPAHAEVEAVAGERTRLYRALAWRRIDTSDHSAGDVVHLIEKLLHDDGNAEVANAD